MSRGYALLLTTLGVAGFLLGRAWPTSAPEPPAPLPDRPTAAPAKEGADVVLVVWDTVRADRLSLYGADRATTPHLERRATAGLVFEQAYAPSFWTVPSHASLFTGLPVAVHRTNSVQPWLPDAFTTLAESFRQAGYETWALVANPNLSERTNLMQGFDRVWSHRDPTVVPGALALVEAKVHPDDASNERGPRWEGDRLEAAKDIGPLIAEQAEAWLRAREAGRPVFLFVNYMEAHGPRLPGGAFREALIPPHLLRAALQTPGGFSSFNDANRGRRQYTAAEREALLAVYDATLGELDATTERLFQVLDRHLPAERRITALTSDHGEAFGEHGYFGHNLNLFNETIHVPLVLWAPDLLPARSQLPVAVKDLFGTLLDLAGLERPAAPAPLGSILETPRGAPIVSELTAPHGMPPGAPERDRSGAYLPHRRRWQALVQDQWKLISRSDGSQALYDLSVDPGETRDLSADLPHRAEALMTLHAGWRQAQGESERVRLEADERRRRREAEEEVPLQALEALGYLE